VDSGFGAGHFQLSFVDDGDFLFLLSVAHGMFVLFVFFAIKYKDF